MQVSYIPIYYDPTNNFVRSKHGKPPTILIDIKEFSQLVVQRDETGIVCGGRHPYYMFKIRKLLEALKNAGAILVFFAVGSKLNDVPHIFIPKREAEYTKYLKILQRIDEKVPIRQILKQKNRKSADIRATLSVEHNLIKVCKQYGEVHYNYVRHNQEIAQYANMHENDVLAIIAGDTDFLVFDGQFEYWPATQIDEKELMGVRVCRQTVWDALEVTPQQLAMVGALSGSIYLPQYVDKVKAFYEKIERGGPEFLKIRDLTTYVRNIRQTPIGNGATIEFDVDAVARDVFGDGYADEEMNTIKNGLAIYNLKFKIPMEKDLMLQQLKRFDRLLYLIQMTDKVFNVRDIAYIDFQNVRSKTYAELVCPLLLRILGIMFIERQGSDFAREICMKFSHEDPYEVVEESPCYPPSDLRFPFRKLYEDRNNERPHKWQLLLWTIDVDYSLWEKFKDLPHDMVTPLATLTYLVEVRRRILIDSVSLQ